MYFIAVGLPMSTKTYFHFTGFPFIYSVLPNTPASIGGNANSLDSVIYPAPSKSIRVPIPGMKSINPSSNVIPTRIIS